MVESAVKYEINDFCIQTVDHYTCKYENIWLGHAKFTAIE